MTDSIATEKSKVSQRTLKKEIFTTGKGLFTGEQVALRLCPARENCGISFQRVDLPDRPLFPASLEHIIETPRCTVLGSRKAPIQMIEHLLSALSAFGIDNLLIQVEGPEIPVGDGSAMPFVKMVEEAGVQDLNCAKKIHRISSPVHWTCDDIQIIALPSNEYRLSYTMHYPHSSFLGSQYFTYLMEQESYRSQIASCRTFSLFEEVAPLVEKGLLKGGGLDTALVIKENKVLNPEGARFEDEPVRHKILDLIGDLSLIGLPFQAHVIAIRSGHFSNIAFAKKLKKHFIMENL